MDQRYLILALVTVCILVIIAFFKFRRDMPYQFDIIRLKDGVAVIGVEEWLERDLEVKVLHKGKVVAESVLNSTSHSCRIKGIKVPEDGTIFISRIDIPGKLLYRPFEAPFSTPAKDQRYIVLVGASIGLNWQLPKFPERMGIDDLVIGYRCKYDFDKEDLLRVITGYEYKPELVIIKECSAYFPRTLDTSYAMLEKWIALLRNSNIGVALATTVPVTDDPKHLARQNSLEQWNDHLRALNAAHGYRILEIARAVQTEPGNLHLRKDYAIEDGIHLTEKAYREALDPTLKNFLGYIHD